MSQVKECTGKEANLSLPARNAFRPETQNQKKSELQLSPAHCRPQKYLRHQKKSKFDISGLLDSDESTTMNMDNLQREAQGNMQREMQGNLQTETQGNLQRESQGNLQKETQVNLQREAQGNLQRERQGKLQRERQGTTDKGKLQKETNGSSQRGTDGTIGRATLQQKKPSIFVKSIIPESWQKRKEDSLAMGVSSSLPTNFDDIEIPKGDQLLFNDQGARGKMKMWFKKETVTLTDNEETVRRKIVHIIKKIKARQMGQNNEEHNFSNNINKTCFSAEEFISGDLSDVISDTVKRMYSGYTKEHKLPVDATKPQLDVSYIEEQVLQGLISEATLIARVSQTTFVETYMNEVDRDVTRSSMYRLLLGLGTKMIEELCHHMMYYIILSEVIEYTNLELKSDLLEVEGNIKRTKAKLHSYLETSGNMFKKFTSLPTRLSSNGKIARSMQTNTELYASKFTNE